MVAGPAAYQPPPAFGKYRVGALLGQGGMASVFRAEDTLLERPVALKFLRRDIARNPVARQRFLREARLVAKLAHPNIVAVFDFGTLDDGTWYQASELVTGQTLRELLRGGPIEPARALRFARQLALGLASAHELGVIHRDLKPSNVMVVPDRTAPDGCRLKILDFGIAKQLTAGDGEKVTRTGVAVGTPGYMSPEQAAGGKVGPASDVYSLGVVLFAMLCGRSPFEAADTDALLEAHRHQAPPRPSELAPCSRAVDDVVARCLEKAAAARPRMGEVIAMIDTALEAGERAPPPAIAAEAVAAAAVVPEEPRTALLPPAASPLVRHAYEAVDGDAPAPATVGSEATTVPRAAARHRRTVAIAGLGILGAVVGIALAAGEGGSDPPEAAAPASVTVPAGVTAPAPAEVARPAPAGGAPVPAEVAPAPVEVAAPAPSAEASPSAEAAPPARSPEDRRTRRSHPPAPKKPAARAAPPAEPERRADDPDKPRAYEQIRL